jgi:predicted MFS family arabinose efflux permease
VAVVAAPDVEREHRIAHGGYALLVFALPLLGGALLEAALTLISDRYPRRRAVRVASFATAAALLLCALASEGALLALGLLLAGTASGVACSAAKGELLLAPGVSGERAMARWALFGALGDVLTPLFVALVLGAGDSYRLAFLAAAGLATLQGLMVAPPAHEAPEVAAHAAPEEVASEPLLASLRAAARKGQLWLWLLGAALCTFLDELVIALSALHAERDLGASPALAVACVTGASAGAVIGAWVTDRLLARVAPDRVLLGSTGATLAALLAVVWAPSVGWLAPALVVLGATSVPQFALLEAKAYAASPGRPGVVAALAQVFVLIDIGGPLILGLLADAFGLSAALACLAVQPLGVLLVLWRSARGARRRERAEREPPE